MDLDWTCHRAYWKARMYCNTHLGWRIHRRHYNGKRILDIPKTGDAIAAAIRSGTPYCVARLGGTELRSIVACQPQQRRASEREKYYGLLQSLSGFFGTREEYAACIHLMERSLAQVDLIGVWHNQMEDYICRRYGSPALIYGKLEGLEPWYVPERPWSAALAGKRVVVVHPFARSIEAQYARRERIYPGTDILPAFSLRTVPAVQTLAGQQDPRYGSWEEALDEMTASMLSEDFDVALIACGAYGMPLATRCKEAGRVGIHVGGALQLLFGIMGNRWEGMPQIAPYVSDAWVRPLEEERLKDGAGATVENNCYW